MKKLEELKSNEEGKCPLCNCEMIEYGVSEVDCDTMWYPCTCEKCGATWNEVYKLSFLQVDDVCDNEGNDVYNSYEE